MTDLVEPSGRAPKSEWAGYLADLGRTTGAFKVFRCKPDVVEWNAEKAINEHVGKEPLRGERWKQTATWDRKTALAMWQDSPDSNIGLAVQIGFVVLDADLYKVGAEAALAEFERKRGKLPHTMEFASASGGKHMIYATDKLFGNGEGSLPDFGDVRGYGGYIVGPGSTFQGNRYTIVDADPPAPLPQAVDACLIEKRSASASEKTLPPGYTLDAKHNVTRYSLWLQTKANPGKSGTDGNNMLAAAGSMGASYGLSQDKVVELLIADFNPRCNEAWSEEQIERHGGSGYRGASSAFGNMADPDFGFTAVAGAAQVATSSVFKRVSEFASVAPPPRRWVVGTDADGWIVEDDITIEYGPGGAGKSIQSAQMCRDISRGEPVFGLLPCRRMPTLFIGCEDDTAEMHRRFHKLGVRDTDDVTFACLGGQETVLHPPFKPGAAMGEDTPTFSLISHQLATMPAGPKFLVLDNLAHLFHGNYFDPGNISTFLNGYLRRWVKQFNTAVLLLAHPSENQTASGSGGYGGIGWSAGVRSRLYFEPHVVKSKVGNVTVATRVGDERVFSRKKSNYTREHREGEGLILDWKDWSFVPVERKAPNPFTPVEKPERRAPSAAENAVLPIVQRAVEETLASNPSKAWSARELSTGASVRMGKAGHRLLPDTIRKSYLPELISMAHPAFDSLSSVWRHATVH